MINIPRVASECAILRGMKRTEKQTIERRTLSTVETPTLEHIPQDTAPLELKSITHPKKRVFLEIFYATMGNIKKACRYIQITRSTYYKWMKDDAKFADLVHLQQQELNDDMKTKLLELAEKDNNLGAIIFYLRSRHPEFQQKSMSYENAKEGVTFTLTRG